MCPISRSSAPDDKEEIPLKIVESTTLICTLVSHNLLSPKRGSCRLNFNKLFSKYDLTQFGEQSFIKIPKLCTVFTEFGLAIRRNDN